MRIKLELNQKKYEGNVEVVNEPITNYLIQAENEPEVFVVIDRVKHWIQNIETAIEKGYDIYKREILSLDRVNYFITGDTYNTIGEPERARDIYYPEAEKVQLYQAIGEDEVFITENNEKHWLENGETAIHYAGSNWMEKLEGGRISLKELNDKYITGDTYNVLSEPTRARDIYYPEEELEFVKIGETSDRFIWSLMEHNDKVYIGTYGTPKVYSYSPWKFLTNLPANESIRNFMRLKGKLYAATENLGHIYRMDSPTSWTKVHDDSYVVCLAFNILKDHLYCGLWNYPTEETKIIRSSNGTNWEQVKHWSNRTIEGPTVLHEEELYVFGGWRRSGNVAWAAKTSDGLNWPDVPALCGHNGVLGDCGTSFKGKLFIGLSQRNDHRAEILSLENGICKEVFSSNKASDNHSCCVAGNWLYWMIGPLWKHEGTTYLYRTSTGEPGNWNLVKAFEGKPNGRALIAIDDKVYVGVQNKLYEIR